MYCSCSRSIGEEVMLELIFRSGAQEPNTVSAEYEMHRLKTGNQSVPRWALFKYMRSRYLGPGRVIFPLPRPVPLCSEITVRLDVWKYMDQCERTDGKLVRRRPTVISLSLETGLSAQRDWAGTESGSIYLRRTTTSI